MHIRKRPSGKYQCIIHLNGISTSKTFRDKKSCQIWGREQESLIDSGMYRRVPDRLTLRQIIQLYVDKCVPFLKTQKSVTDQLNRLCNNYSWLVDMQYKNIKPIHFEEFKNQRIKDIGNIHIYKNNHRAVNKDLRLMSIAINKAKYLWLYPIRNHIRYIKFLPESDGLYRKIRGYEHRELLRCANTIQKAFLLLLRHTGARPKELLNVSWINLDQSRNELTIPWDINKTNKGRVIPLRPFLAKWLYKNLYHKEGRIIQYSYTAFRFWFYRRTKERRFEDLTIYHYRRNFVQYYADRNIPLPKLALMTGHRSYSMIARYYGHHSLIN